MVDVYKCCSSVLCTRYRSKFVTDRKRIVVLRSHTPFGRRRPMSIHVMLVGYSWEGAIVKAMF